jgi:hypothetical protein
MGAKRNTAKIERFLDRDLWIKRMLGSSLSAPAKIVTTCLALHLNINRRELLVSNTTLAAETNYSERHVRRLIEESEKAGWIDVTHSSGRHVNSYSLTIPSGLGSEQPTRTCDVRVAAKSNPDIYGTQPGHNSVRVGPHQPGHMESSTTARKERERGTAHVARATPAPSFSAGEGQPAAGGGDAAPPAEFEAFWAVYPKQVGKLAAEQEFKKALQHTPAAEIIDGARRYAIDPHRVERSREGNDRFTKEPKNWLRDRRWTDKLSGVTIDQFGNPVAAPRSRKHNGSANWDEVGEQVKAQMAQMRLIKGGRS